MGTLSRVSAGQKVKMLRVVLALVLVAVAWGQTCLLRNIPVKTDLDERRLIGRWYEMKWHAGSAARLALWNNKYSDYFIDLNIHGHHGYPNYYNYNFFDGSMGMHGGMMHPDLVVPMKEKLIAEKEKLISEKAYFLIMREKLQLEIQRLRTGHAGGPKA